MAANKKTPKPKAKVKSTARSAKAQPRSKKSGWIRRQLSRKYAIPFLFALAFAVIGVATLVYSHAATDVATGPIKWSQGFCLDDYQGQLDARNKIEIWPCNGRGSQRWRLPGDGTIHLGSSDYCLDVKYAGTAPKTIVWLWKCNGTVAQQWVAHTDGSLVNPHSGLCLANSDARAVKGNQIWIYTCDQGIAQRWTVPAPPAPQPAPTPSPAPTPTPTPTLPVSAAQPCGVTATPPPRYKHVIWILEENRSLDEVIGSANAPYITSLARKCAYSTKFIDNEPDSSLGTGYHSVSHYIANLAGTNCVTGNGKTGTGCLLDSATYGPITHTSPMPTILGQILGAGMTWKSYQESAPRNCTLSDQKIGLYAPWHDGVLYFTRDREACKKYDVPIPALSGTPKGELINDIRNNTLPNFAYVTPNLENDMHNVGPANADKWLKAYLPELFDSKTYKQGDTAVFLLWDEARTTNDVLPNLMIAPTAKGGAVATTVNGFAVLGTTEDLLGLPRLGCATGTPPGNVGKCYAGATANLRQSMGF